MAGFLNVPEMLTLPCCLDEMGSDNQSNYQANRAPSVTEILILGLNTYLKGFPTNKLSNLVGWASCPPSLLGRARSPSHKKKLDIF